MFSDVAFMKKVASTLYKTQSRSQQHIWSKAKYGIHNQNGSNGLPSHANGIVGGTIPINDMLMAWWCQYSVNHGYGIFHLAKQDPTTDTCTLVSFNTLPFKYLFIYLVLRLSHLATPDLRKRFRWQRMELTNMDILVSSTKIVTFQLPRLLFMQEQQSAPGYDQYYSHKFSNANYF